MAVRSPILVRSNANRHKNLFHTTPEINFKAAVDQLSSRLGELNDDEIVVGFAKIAALAEDGHSGILYLPEGNTYFPLRMRYFSDELYVESTTSQNKSLVGARLVSVNNTSSVDLLQMMSKIIGHDPDNLGLVKRFGPTLMVSSNVLHGLGVIDTTTKATYHFEKSGSAIDVTLKPEVPYTALIGYASMPGWVSAR